MKIALMFKTKLPVRNYCQQSSLKQCYQLLGLKEDSDLETVKKAFINLAKRYHPDSKSNEADQVKFQRIESAYRIIQESFADKHVEPEEVEQDIQHTAPQHRQYLSFGGYGSGTPSQREHQYARKRAERAAENVTEYRISRLQEKDCSTLINTKEKKKVKDIRTFFGMDRLVEDLIQESMSKGEFKNLSGFGKPLKTLQKSHNPYVDFTTHKLNEVLIDNGFKPQWITLQKEIREDIENIKQGLSKVRAKLGPLPLNNDDLEYWSKELVYFQDRTKILNAKIDFYNLVVPMLNKQSVHFDLDAVAGKVLKEAPPKIEIAVQKSEENEPNKIVEIINFIFNKKINKQ